MSEERLVLITWDAIDQIVADEWDGMTPALRSAVHSLREYTRAMAGRMKQDRALDELARLGQEIEFDPIATAPTDGRVFDAILGGAPNVMEAVKFEVGRWHVYRGSVPSPTPGAANDMEVWQNLPEGIYPTHWVKGSERYLAAQTNGPKQDVQP